MKRDRDTWLAIGLGLVLLFITVISVVQQTQDRAPIPYTSHSSNPDGTRALFLWLEALGYRVSNAVSSEYSILEEASTAIIMEPTFIISEQEWELIDAWVEAGGTLILAGNGWEMRLITRHYNFHIASSNARSWPISPQVPFLGSPPVERSITSPDAAYLQSNRGDMVVLFANKGLPVIVTFDLGQGRVIVSATAYPFSNAGLKEAGNPALALNLLTSAQNPGAIWFDEWHHGLRGPQETAGGFKEWLLRTPPGNALVYAVVVVFIALILQGRYFGIPVPLPSKTARPAPIEYITAIANLNRRAGYQAATLQQYHQGLKRALGERHRINPLLPDEVFLEHLAKHMPQPRIQELGSIFTRLKLEKQSEPDFVRLAAEAAGWTHDYDHGWAKKKSSG